MIVYVSIGNSDDKLTQSEWAGFQGVVQQIIDDTAEETHGRWASLPTDPWQNACWCIRLESYDPITLKKRLRSVAEHFRQDSIAWAEVRDTEFLGPDNG